MNKQNNLCAKISQAIINQKILILILFTVISIFSALKLSDTVIENDLTQYLAEDSITRVGTTAMIENFGETVAVNFMIKSDDTYFVESNLMQNSDIYLLGDYSEKDGYLLYELSFNSTTSALDGKTFIEEKFENEEFYLSSTAYVSTADYMEEEMQTVLVYAIIVIVLILLLTASSYGIVPILLLVFGVSALISTGTNFIFKDISYISNSVAVILQLALAIDYALIFVHRYDEERKNSDPNTSAKIALSKTIPEVSASSLTTISGFIALSFMSYGIGKDMAMVLIKSIMISLGTVFLLLPILTVIFDKVLQKTTHRQLVPSISKIIEKSVNLRKVIVPIFLIVAVLSISFASKTNYTFSINEIGLNGDEDTQKIQSVFTTSNTLAILTPAEESSTSFLEEVGDLNGIESVLCLENIEILEGITISTEVNYQVVTALFDVDVETALMLFGGYALTNGEYDIFTQDMDSYTISVQNILGYLAENSDTLTEGVNAQLNQVLQGISMIEEKFVNDTFNVLLLTTSLDVESEETFNFVEQLIEKTDTHFSTAHIIGESVNSYELKNSFELDRIIVNGLSAIFIAIILLVSFKSVVSAFIMIFCIQTAINLNFSIPYFQNSSLFFIGYLVVVAIQMGATIDYAIVIVSRYKQLLKSLNPKDAIVKAVDTSFSTIISSGGVLSIAGFVMYKTSSDAVISSLGLCLSRGTLISMLLVLFVLPSMFIITSKKKNQ